MHDNMIHLETATSDGRTGWVEFSPYLNVFERRCDIRLPHNMEKDPEDLLIQGY